MSDCSAYLETGIHCADRKPCEHGWPGCSAPTNCPKCVAQEARRALIEDVAAWLESQDEDGADLVMSTPIATAWEGLSIESFHLLAAELRRRFGGPQEEP